MPPNLPIVTVSSLLPLHLGKSTDCRLSSVSFSFPILTNSTAGNAFYYFPSVLPLMQIVGNDESPKVPVTRVVQIPLFKYEQGRGADVILDHILGMLHPR